MGELEIEATSWRRYAGRERLTTTKGDAAIHAAEGLLACRLIRIRGCGPEGRMRGATSTKATFGLGDPESKSIAVQTWTGLRAEEFQGG